MFTHDEEYTIKRLGNDLMDHVILTKKSKFPGVEYQYGKVQLIEDPIDGLRVKFEYEVFDNPKKFDTKSDKFIQYIGSILIEVIEQEATYVLRTQE